MKKKIDSRVKTVIENCVKLRQRSFFVIVGDRGREQVVNLHYILSKTAVKARPSVLWCYKKDLGFSSNKQKRLKQTNKLLKRGLLDPDRDDPFELFLSSTDIRFTYYSETQKILGNTYGMCVLQDFEAVTPNILARTIETVEGGGIVVLLLRTMSSLKQLFSMTMDVHSRFRTESQVDVVPRFNERFLLSLSSCKTCLVVDDEFNVLPISTNIRDIQPVQVDTDDGITYQTPQEKDLKKLKESMKETQPVGSLVGLARTLDQAKSVMQFVDAIAEKTLRTTIALTAARGRGKSSAMGLSLAAAVAYGYSNIFVTSPSPENLKTFFEFVFKGFDSLGYKEHVDYDIVQSTNPEFNSAIVRVNIFREHRQTIQYIHPGDSAKLAQAEIVVIDEAAAIPLPLVKSMLGPYLVFIASTVNGYEGTGRSLSLKLIQQLREQSRGGVVAEGVSAKAASLGRSLREMSLQEPIRYSLGDPVESWLNTLLCLDASNAPASSGKCPHPDQCELYYVNRETLFSFHKASEAFLQKMMALYVASHYRNTPNDLQLMADAPGHNLFVLLGPVDPESDSLPEVLCVIQASLEGEISKESIQKNLSQGHRPAGDLIPYTVATQFQDADFARLSGARVIRIATHPEYQKMGYGSRALNLMRDYYNGNFTSLDEEDAKTKKSSQASATAEGDSIQSEVIVPRKNLPPLLLKLSERRPEALHYLGVSYGITEPLFKFWSRSGYKPVYLRQTSNELTGENTCVMLAPLTSTAAASLKKGVDGTITAFYDDFRRRFLSLSGYDFRAYSVSLALSVIGYGRDRKLAAGSENDDNEEIRLSKSELYTHFSPYDLGRLEAYCTGLVDYHVIVDMLPTIAKLLFTDRISFSVSAAQAAILFALGLQHRSVDDLQKELNLTSAQVLALFGKAIRRISSHFRKIQEREVESKLLSVSDSSRKMIPLKKTLDEELKDEPDRTSKKKPEYSEMQKMVDGLHLDHYKVVQDDSAWDAVLPKNGESLSSISVASKKHEKKRSRVTETEESDVRDKKKQRKHKSSSS
eukprot:ANDGO_01938.mRNA.1 RNA cytidine acetyltransferase